MTKTNKLPSNPFIKHANIKTPVICGAMYPCSNPELVAAVSDAGALGVIQPMSLTYVFKYDLREGIQKMKALTDHPLAFNAIIEQSVEKYERVMNEWVDIALDEGIRFFITALGNPAKMVKKIHAKGGIVYHDVTARKWAEKAVKAGVDGLICVNNRAGGHAGTKSPEELYDELKDLGLPLICAGGVGNTGQFEKALEIGYQGVQMGTRFIASKECSAHQDYKQAIHDATSKDIVLTDKISGVPVSIIQTDYIKKIGTKANFVMRKMLAHSKLKHYARLYYTMKAVIQLKKSTLKGAKYKDYFQAGKSVSGIDSTETVHDIIGSFDKTYRKSQD